MDFTFFFVLGLVDQRVEKWRSARHIFNVITSHKNCVCISHLSRAQHPDHLVHAASTQTAQPLNGRRSMTAQLLSVTATTRSDQYRCSHDSVVGIKRESCFKREQQNAGSHRCLVAQAGNRLLGSAPRDSASVSHCAVRDMDRVLRSRYC